MDKVSDKIENMIVFIISSNYNHTMIALHISDSTSHLITMSQHID